MTSIINLSNQQINGGNKCSFKVKQVCHKPYSKLNTCTFFWARTMLSLCSTNASKRGFAKWLWGKKSYSEMWNYLLFSASFGKLIVNLQVDARKEFKGSTAWSTPHAWELSHGNHRVHCKVKELIHCWKSHCNCKKRIED